MPYRSPWRGRDFVKRNTPRRDPILPMLSPQGNIENSRLPRSRRTNDARRCPPPGPCPCCAAPVQLFLLREIGGNTSRDRDRIGARLSAPRSRRQTGHRVKEEEEETAERVLRSLFLLAFFFLSLFSPFSLARHARSVSKSPANRSHTGGFDMLFHLKLEWGPRKGAQGPRRRDNHSGRP